MAYTPEERARFERNWSAEAAQEALTQDDLGVWFAGKHVQRMMVFQDKVLLHYSNTSKGPKIHNIVRIRGLDASFDAGLSVNISFNDDPGIHTFGHHPTKLRDESSVFIWTTYFPDFQRTKLTGGNFATWFAIAIKQETKPEHVVKGAEHLVEVKHFKQIFPQYKNTTF